MRNLFRVLAAGSLCLVAGMSAFWAPPVRGSLVHRSDLGASVSGWIGPTPAVLARFAGRVQRVGDSRFGTSFAGVRVEGDHLDVYVVRFSGGGFVRVVAAMNQFAIPIRVIAVPRSYAVQKAGSGWVRRHLATLRRQGIVPEWWGPSPAADATVIMLRRPTSANIADLRQAVKHLGTGRSLARHHPLIPAKTINSSTYLSVAQLVLAAESPVQGDIILFHALGHGARVASGAADSTPFYGGDEIFYRTENYDQCTGGFGVTLDSDNNAQYMITAAHCRRCADHRRLGYGRGLR